MRGELDEDMSGEQSILPRYAPVRTADAVLMVLYLYVNSGICTFSLVEDKGDAKGNTRVVFIVYIHFVTFCSMKRFNM